MTLPPDLDPGILPVVEDLDDTSDALPWDFDRVDCDDTDGDLAPYPDIDARCFPTAPLYVTGNVPGAMLWSLAGADGDCDGKPGREW